MSRYSVCILGGTGFVGSRLAARLLRAGHAVTVLSRDPERHKALLVMPGLALERCDVYAEAALAERLRGYDVAINLVGILNERGFGGRGFRKAHTQLTETAIEAARSAGVRRFLQVSSLGAAEDAPSHYLRSKGAAERRVRERAGPMEWVIYRPSVIFGPGDSFLNRFAALLAAVPWVLPLAMPDAKLQPVHVDDVVEALRRGVDGSVPSGTTLELGGPRVTTLREVVRFVANCTGRPHRILGLPRFVSRLQAFGMDFVPGRPFSSDNYRSLTVDSVCGDDGFAQLGLRPRSMEGSAPEFLGARESNARFSRWRRRAARD
jgi:NADH dehydrogenase